VDHRDVAGQAVLLDEVAHPGAALLALALEGVEVEQGELGAVGVEDVEHAHVGVVEDRKSTRLNSSHVKTSYAVFCLKKKHTRPSPLAFATHEISVSAGCSISWALADDA